jgi:aminoglycoside phosphotransferase (APT) family kinase protein
MMPIGTKPPAEVTIDQSLVRALIQEQHTDLAHLALSDVGEGWDNRLFRLGDDRAVRVPRRAISATLIEHEQRWLPRLSPQLPLPIPVPHRVGRPGCGFPWSWSITSWFPGQTALRTPPQDLSTAGDALGHFLRALHQPAPVEAPHNPWRGVPLAARTSVLMDHLQHVDGLVDRAAVLELWERALSAPPWSGPSLWIHGDLHPGNLLVSEGRLSAVIDFGDLTAGDPATDLSVIWMLLPPSTRSAFRASARGAFDSLDDHTLLRARGWALALGLAYLVNSQDDDAMGMMGLATIDAALNHA